MGDVVTAAEPNRNGESSGTSSSGEPQWPAALCVCGHIRLIHLAAPSDPVVRCRHDFCVCPQFVHQERVR